MVVGPNRSRGVNPASPGLSVGAAPIVYTVITNWGLSPVNATGTCPLPGGLGSGTGPCITTEIDIGDAVALRHGARDLDIVGARLQSNLGTSFHVWPAGGTNFHLLHNVLGQNHHSTSYTALQIDPDPSGVNNPENYDIEGNDLVGATPIAAPMPTATFQAGGLPPVMRNNRGANGVIIGPTMVSSVTVLTIRNAGPFDCTYYFSGWSSAFSSATIAAPGATPAPLPTGEPVSAFVPAGAIFQASAGTTPSSVTYLAFCQP
jgi:hypothetical protein